MRKAGLDETQALESRLPGEVSTSDMHMISSLRQKVERK